MMVGCCESPLIKVLSMYIRRAFNENKTQKSVVGMHGEKLVVCSSVQELV